MVGLSILVLLGRIRGCTWHPYLNQMLRRSNDALPQKWEAALMYKNSSLGKVSPPKTDLMIDLGLKTRITDGCLNYWMKLWEVTGIKSSEILNLYVPTSCLLITMGIRVQWRNLADTTLSKWPKLAPPVMGPLTSYLLTWCIEDAHHVYGPPSKNAEPDPTYSARTWIPEYSKSNWTALFQNVSVMKAIERLKNFSRITGTKDTWQLNAICDKDWSLDQWGNRRKEHFRIVSKIWILTTYWIIVLCQC